MLTTDCIHPKILEVVASCGHGDKILIADGNYPLNSCTNENTTRVFLGLAPDLPTVTDVLKVLNNTTNFEKAEVMDPQGGEEPEIFKEFIDILDTGELDKLGRYEFYEAAQAKNIILGINTGETRTFANILLTVGVR
ncbi:RbsD/FucU family protein [Thermoactinomyces mirandus]|uniref:RbsD or FucU transport n=1 Tax=Thermoactinomyces mirandus TaxID=2756294 RepID=A0A7W2ASG2_9BACL|nr:RbsD/FucU family protein [Thermoactinomyces mirandus]MBA4603397.1 RbsD or FucU transport [Thermoactinomyces mirandus]